MKTLKKYCIYFVYKIFGSVRNTVFVALFVIMATAYVGTRMKGVELDYAVHQAGKDYNEINIRNKELKAQRASIFSAERLRKISVEHKLAVPKQEQVIVISE